MIDYTYAPHQLKNLAIRKLAEFVIAHEHKPENTEASISFISNDAIAELNEHYRGKTGPTDVLSFECDNLNDGFAQMGKSKADEVYELGDIVIAPDVAYAQCKEYGNSFQEEIELLLVHGLLHLCGYDHIKDRDAEIMQAREKELLSKWALLEK